MNKKITICLAALIAVLISASADAKIIAYSASWCGFCVKLEQYLKKHNVSFERINVDKNRAAKGEAERKSGQRGIPVLDWEGEIITGFGESEKKEIDRLIAGGVPVEGKFIPGRSVPSKKSQEKHEKIDYEKALYDFIYGQIKDLKNLFALAGEKVNDAYAADILKKLYNAHLARIIYEAAFTEQFRGRIEQTTTDNDRDGVKLMGTVKNIAAKKYSEMYDVYRDARAKNLQAGIDAQQALKLAIKQKQSEGSGGSYNQNAQGYLLKLWACAAINPSAGGRLQPDSNDSPDLTQDAVTARAVKIINELTNIQNEVDIIEDPNGLVASE